MAEVTDREQEIMEHVRAGLVSPSQLAIKLGISESGASQALHRLASKGRLLRRKSGRAVQYELMKENSRAELYFLFQAYNAMSQVWAYLISRKLSQREMQRARVARETLEKLLAKRRSQ